MFGEWVAHGQPTVLFLGLLKTVPGWLELDQKCPCVVCMRPKMAMDFGFTKWNRCRVISRE